MKKFIQLLTLIAISLNISACSSKGGLFGSGSKDANKTGLSESDLNYQREARYGSGDIPMAEEDGMFRDVRFSYDSSVIDDLAMQDIEYNAQVIQDNAEIRVQLEGHCDERGTSEYNLSLGSQRAKSVKDLLISFGVPSSRLDTISYGEEVPLDASSNDRAWSKNRRVHFSPYN